jgi:plasmid stabilization system protein ParE
VCYLAEFDAANTPLRTGEIIQAIAVLEQNPLIGRPVKGGKRNLVIGRESHGYFALCCYIVEIDTLVVLAVRGQREAGYTRT